MENIEHLIMDAIVLIALSQHALETFDLFDGIILFSLIRKAYNRTRSGADVLEFFELIGSH